MVRGDSLSDDDHGRGIPKGEGVKAIDNKSVKNETINTDLICLLFDWDGFCGSVNRKSFHTYQSRPSIWLFNGENADTRAVNCKI